MVIADLLPILKDRMADLTYRIVDEDLVPNTTSYAQYNSQHKLWVDFPPARVRSIDLNAVETYIFPTDYSINDATGVLTFYIPRASTETIRVDYSFFPFDDTDMQSFLDGAVKQVQVLSLHTIPTNFSSDYQEAILKKAYVIALRKLQFPTTKYFSVSVGGRTMDKSTQVTNINAMIESIEKELLVEINSLRYFNKTNVLS